VTRSRPPAVTTARLRRNLIILVVLVILAVGVIVAVPGLDEVTSRLADVSPGWVVLAIALEVLSCIGYVIAFQQVFAQLPRSTARAVAWSEMAFQTVVPAGGAGGLALGGWIVHQKGAPWGRIAERSTVLFLLTSAVNMVVLTIFGLLLALGVLPGPRPLLLGGIPAAVGASVLLFVIALPRLLTSRVRARQWKRQRVKSALEGLAESIRDTERFLLSGGWGTLGAVAYLVFDIAVLWICFLAFGNAPQAAALVLGYQIGYLAGAVPIPGGIGVLDGGLIAALALYGVNATAAATAVLVYHAIWLFVPLVIGTVAFLRLERHLDEPLPEPDAI
jgi:uncharacterized membrane protein YbhN (UPF0104 family)